MSEKNQDSNSRTVTINDSRREMIKQGLQTLFAEGTVKRVRSQSGR